MKGRPPARLATFESIRAHGKRKRKSIDCRQAKHPELLDILRDMRCPIAVNEATQRLVALENLGDVVEGLNSHLTSRSAATLDGLYSRTWFASDTLA